MTVKYDDREAIAHGKLRTSSLREKPGFPSWAMKLTMAITGIIFALFVLVHMVGNLKVYMGAESFNTYADFLREFGYPLLPHESFLWVARIVLLVSLILHVWCAFALTGRAHQSRGRYRRKGMVSSWNTFTARSMIVTGIVLLLFIIFHILDLTMGVQPVAPEAFVHGAVKANMIATFSRWPVTIIYVIAMLCLFLHLTHGIRLAASDLGITGAKWREVFVILAYVVPAVVCLANIVMPLSVALGWVS